MARAEDKVLLRATFDAKLKTYWFVSGLLTMLFTLIGIPLIPFWLLGWGLIWCRKRFDALQCVLHERSLAVAHGVWFRTEKTIPLDKIQDLTLLEGPLLNYFGLCSLKIETAGQSSAQGQSDASLIGVVGAREFRDRVLEQRDLVSGGGVSVSSPVPDESGKIGQVSDSTRVLEEILATLRSIDERLRTRGK